MIDRFWEGWRYSCPLRKFLLSLWGLWRWRWRWRFGDGDRVGGVDVIVIEDKMNGIGWLEDGMKEDGTGKGNGNGKSGEIRE